MNWLFCLIGASGALFLIAAAFVYLFVPRRAVQLLKQVGIALLVLLVLVPLAWQLVSAADPLALCIALALMSVTAFFVRERRMRGRKKPRPVGRAERVPVVPPQLPRDNR